MIMWIDSNSYYYSAEAESSSHLLHLSVTMVSLVLIVGVIIIILIFGASFLLSPCFSSSSVDPS
jgi:hypothetical protein